ncbi:hypothetical protein ACFWHT_09655 [Microbacterium sp. NPDC058342]|uniref:hypothetical protein n=1 Tax=Microbacterium sp. NPDC058342 TaxID=3346454 RepID=UPI00364DF73D
MERKLVIAGSAPVPRGNRVEIAQARADGEVVAVHDLDRGILRTLRELPRDHVDLWRATVRDCAIVETARGVRTTLTVIAVDAAGSAADALSEADAAAAAAKAESDRWGGSDRPPAETTERFW